MSNGNSSTISEVNNNNGEKIDNRNGNNLFSNISNNKNGHATKFNNGVTNAGKIDSKNNTPKVAKASKKLGTSSSAAGKIITSGRPSMEIYRPPGMRHSGSAKSTEDISSPSSPPVPTTTNTTSSTKPSAAGTKQPLSTTSSSSSTTLHTMANNNNATTANNAQNYNYVFTQQPQQLGSASSNWRQQDTRTYTRTNNGLEREKSKSSKNLNYQYQNGYGAGGQRSADYDDYYERMRRSQTPPPSLAASRQLSCPDHLSKKGDDGGKLKRQRSFIKDLPKKKSSFTEKEANEARMILMALEMAQDEYVADWITGNYATEEVANTVGQVLVQLAIEHNKPTKLITKLSSLLMECNSGEAFHKGLVTSSYRYFECREQLRAEHFRFWLNFVNFLSELHANMGFTYEGELSQILFQLYDYLLQSPILDNVKIEELESLISSLVNVGYDLERQCPDRLTELRNTLRNAFISAQEPWARKMILLLIELSASNWKLPSDASDYYFQTHSNILGSG